MTLVIAVVAIAILAAGGILMKNNIATQRAIRDAQQAQEEAEKERAKYGDVAVEEDDESEDEETAEEETEESEQENVETAEEEEDGEEIVEEVNEKSVEYSDFSSRLEELQSDFENVPSADNATMMQYVSDVYRRSDVLLNDIYQHIRENTDSSSFASIQQEERSWIQQRDTKAEEEAADWVGGSGYDLIYYGSATESTLDRCRVLLRYVE
ncbi:MAG: DUF1311 domain-containing protein [Oscillospiraceae bacterium]|nr:DUF1311 domain-containing protein [Oscillospiraceae bacterium]